jgi:hypothetical protein
VLAAQQRMLRLTWPKQLPHATFSDFLFDVKRSAFVGTTQRGKRSIDKNAPVKKKHISKKQ